MATLIDEENNTERDEQSQVQDLNKPIELSEEQKKFIEECEVEFFNRYTYDDLDYFNNKMNRDSCKQEPPIMENWWTWKHGNKSKRRDNWGSRKRSYNGHEPQYHKRPRNSY